MPDPQHPCPQHCSAIKGKIATKQDKIPVDAALLLAYIELIERHNVTRDKRNNTMTNTVLPMTAASPVKISKSTKALRAASTKPADASPKAVKKVTAAKRDTFTSVDLAAEKGINAKTLRARIRRNLAKWEPLFAGEKHTFKDNATTRKAIDALLAADA